MQSTAIGITALFVVAILASFIAIIVRDKAKHPRLTDAIAAQINFFGGGLFIILVILVALAICFLLPTH